MPEENDDTQLTLDKKTVDILVTNVIPTSRYFEVRFDHMQDQLDGIGNNLKDLGANTDRRFDSMKSDMDNRFEKVDGRFDSMKSDTDKRFEQVDNRFEKVDKRFEQVIAAIDRLGDKLENRDEKQRSFTLRMFSIAIGISILGVLGAFLKTLGFI